MADTDPASLKQNEQIEALKRYGWTDDEVASMAPAQRLSELQEAIGSGQDQSAKRDVSAQERPNSTDARIPEWAPGTHTRQPTPPQGKGIRRWVGAGLVYGAVCVLFLYTSSGAGFLIAAAECEQSAADFCFASTHGTAKFWQIEAKPFFASGFFEAEARALVSVFDPPVELASPSNTGRFATQLIQLPAVGPYHQTIGFGHGTTFANNNGDTAPASGGLLG